MFKIIKFNYFQLKLFFKHLTDSRDWENSKYLKQVIWFSWLWN